MNKTRIHIFLALMLFTCYVFLKPNFGHAFDTLCWKNWSIYIFNNGLCNAYNTKINYNPLYLYVLYFFSWLKGSVALIEKNISFLKDITLLFDFIGAYAITSLISKKDNNRFFYPYLLLFNFAYIYNTLIWGQVDSIYTCFTMLGVIFMYKRKLFLSVIFYVLAVNTKMQAIVFLPLFIFLFINYYKDFSKKDKILSIISLVILQILILLPFIMGSGLNKIISVYTDAVNHYQSVSMNACNMWHLIITGNPFFVTDTNKFLAISYRYWGLTLFFVMSVISLLPIGIKSLNSLTSKKNDDENYLKISMLSFALISVVFFYFNTQMHERYSHPVILFIGCYSFISGNYYLYFISSVAYFLNLEFVLKYLGLNNYCSFIFEPQFISILFLIFIIWSIIVLYSKVNINEEFSVLKSNLKSHEN